MSDEGSTRRGVLASALMGVGLVAAYGMLGVQGLLFLLPKRLQARTRLLFHPTPAGVGRKPCTISRARRS